MTYSSEVLADSPSAYYRLNEASGTTLVDSSGNGRNGTFTGSVTHAATGLLPYYSDTATDFTGGYGQVAYNAAWMVPANFTVEFLFRADTIDSAERAIMARHASGAPSWDILVKSGAIRFRFFGWNEITYAISAGQTYHVACTWDGSTRRLYVNGVERAFTGGGYGASTAPISIGHFGNGYVSGGNFDGVIDEVAFYGSALTSTRIAAHYSASASPPPDAILRASESDTAGAIATYRDGGRYYENPTPSGNTQILDDATDGLNEKAIAGMQADGLAPGTAASVTINLWISEDRSGVWKYAKARLRDGSLTGTVLAEKAFDPPAADSTAGHQQQWSLTGTYTPTGSSLLVTIEAVAGPNGENVHDIWSDTRTFVVAQSRANTNVEAGQAVETDAAQAVTVVRGNLAAPVGRATETDTAATITPFIAGAMAAVGRAAETNTAQAVAVALGVVAVPIGQAIEADAASGWTFTQPILVDIGRASEVDTAGLVNLPGVYGVAVALEADEALAVLVLQAPLRNGLGLCLDSSAVLTVDAILEPEPTVPAGTPPTVLHIVAPTVPVPTLVAGRPL